MLTRILVPLIVMSALAFGLAACDDDGGGDGPTATAATDGDAATATAVAGVEEPEPTEPMRDGETAHAATLTIGEDTWTFDILSCDAGLNVGGASITFTLGSLLSSEGERAQLAATVDDEEELGRFEGEGVTHTIGLNDLEDINNLAFGWISVGSEQFIVVDGANVSAETVFDDTLTDEIEEVPGTLAATCP